LSLTFVNGFENLSSGSDYIYIDLQAEFEIETVSVGLHYGYLDDDGIDDQINDYSLSAGRDFRGFDVSVTLTSEDGTDREEFFLTVEREFDL